MIKDIQEDENKSELKPHPILWKITEPCNIKGCSSKAGRKCPHKLCKKHCQEIKNNCPIGQHQCAQRSQEEKFSILWTALTDITKAIRYNNNLVKKYRKDLEDGTVATEKINETMQVSVETASVGLNTAKNVERHELMIRNAQRDHKLG